MSKDKKVEIGSIEPLMLRPKEAARLCGLAVSTWYELRSAGKLPPSIKIGKARLWRLDVLRKCSGNVPSFSTYHIFLFYD